MAPTGPKKTKMEISLDFGAEVKAEVDFLKQLPIFDQEARDKAELARKIERAEKRKQLRNNKGPELTEEDREAEVKRKKELRLQLNRESARRTKVKKEAESSYQKWLTPILTKMAADADKEMFDVVCDQVGLKNDIAKKIRERHELTATRNGSGNNRNRPGTSNSKTGTTPFQNRNQSQQ